MDYPKAEMCEYRISKDPAAEKPYCLELDDPTRHHRWVLKKDLVNKLRKLEGRPKCKEVLAYVNSRLGESGRQPSIKASVQDTLTELASQISLSHIAGVTEGAEHRKAVSASLDALDAKMDRVIEMHRATIDAVDEVSLKQTEMSVFMMAVERMAKRVHVIQEGISNIEEVIDQARFLPKGGGESWGDEEEEGVEHPMSDTSTISGSDLSYGDGRL